ncbi:hypothetical protein ES704_01018 [subsurface metagenome]|jgi:hypothetical protein
MKKISLLIITIILIFSVNVLAVDIDIGNPAIDGIGYLNPDFTFIDLNNPANASGEIKSVELYAKETLSNCEVAIFYLVSGTNYSTRDHQAIGTVIQGAKRTFAVNLDVQAGDYIGVTFTAGTLRAGAETGSIKMITTPGDRIPCTNYNFVGDSERLISLYGTGIIPDIDIGMPAIDRGGYIREKTLINKGNPANADGKITNVEIYAVYGDLTDCWVATFYRPDPGGFPNNFTTRDYVELGTVAVGESNHIVDLDVHTGDYLGIWVSKSGYISTTAAGESGVWSTQNNHIPCTNYNFDWTYTDDAISLYGTGIEIAVGWPHKWNTQTISKWNTKEFTKWNGLE